MDCQVSMTAQKHRINICDISQPWVPKRLWQAGQSHFMLKKNNLKSPPYRSNIRTDP